MNQIQQITNDALQQQTLVLADGSSIVIQLYFMPMQYAWQILSLTYSSFTVTGLRISNNPNILQQFSNVLPFGLACFSTNNREPTQQDDFSSGASNLYILSKAEVAQYTAFLNGASNGL